MLLVVGVLCGAVLCGATVCRKPLAVVGFRRDEERVGMFRTIRVVAMCHGCFLKIL